MYSVALVLPSPESDSGQQAPASGTHLRSSLQSTYLLQYSSPKKKEVRLLLGRQR